MHFPRNLYFCVFASINSHILYADSTILVLAGSLMLFIIQIIIATILIIIGIRIYCSAKLAGKASDATPADIAEVVPAEQGEFVPPEMTACESTEKPTVVPSSDDVQYEEITAISLVDSSAKQAKKTNDADLAELIPAELGDIVLPEMTASESTEKPTVVPSSDDVQYEGMTATEYENISLVASLIKQAKKTNDANIAELIPAELGDIVLPEMTASESTEKSTVVPSSDDVQYEGMTATEYENISLVASLTKQAKKTNDADIAELILDELGDIVLPEMTASESTEKPTIVPSSDDVQYEGMTATEYENISLVASLTKQAKKTNDADIAELIPAELGDIVLPEMTANESMEKPTVVPSSDDVEHEGMTAIEQTDISLVENEAYGNVTV